MFSDVGVTGQPHGGGARDRLETGLVYKVSRMHNHNISVISSNYRNRALNVMLGRTDDTEKQHTIIESR